MGFLLKKLVTLFWEIVGFLQKNACRVPPSRRSAPRRPSLTSEGLAKLGAHDGLTGSFQIMMGPCTVFLVGLLEGGRAR